MLDPARFVLLAACVMAIFLGCHRTSVPLDTSDGGDVDTDSDSDTDTDSESDLASDVDSESDCSTDTETETGTGPDTPAPDDWVDCGSVMSESVYCLTHTNDRVALLGLDSGDLCQLTFTDAPFGAFHSIAWWEGFAVVGGSGSETSEVYLVSPEDGSWEVALVPAQTLAVEGSGLLVMKTWANPENLDTLYYYDTFDDLADDEGTAYSFPTSGSRMTAQGNIVYQAWHSTNEIDRFVFPAGISLSTISLEDYDTWVRGISVTDTGLLVLNAHWPEGRVAVFEVETGVALWNVYPTDSGGKIYGLDCKTSLKGRGPEDPIGIDK